MGPARPGGELLVTAVRRLTAVHRGLGADLPPNRSPSPPTAVSRRSKRNSSCMSFVTVVLVSNITSPYLNMAIFQNTT